MAGYKTGGSGGAPPPPVVAGWIRDKGVDYRALSSTTWTNADQGTNPVVDGVTFQIDAIPAGQVTVGGGAGLATDNGAVTVRTFLDSTRDLSDQEVLAFAYAVDDLGSQQGSWFGDDWTSCWALIRANLSQQQVQRRTNIIGFYGASLATGVATAFLYISTQGTNEVFYRTDAVDPGNLPAPDDSGWILLGSVANNSLANWPIANSSSAQFMFWTNGSTTYTVKGWQVFTVRD